MCNDELFEKLSKDFPAMMMRNYCLMLSKMYNHLYEDCKDPECSELDYERQWWLEKYNELTSNNNYQVS